MRITKSDEKLIKINNIIQKNIIVLADDNHLINNCNKNIISEIFNESKRHYFEIFCVNDGIEILKIFFNYENKDLFKLLITDENMNFLSGSEAI